MMGDLLNQKAILHRLTGYNEYGEPQFEQIEIPCRIEPRTRYTLGLHGETLQSSAVLITNVEVKPEDRIEVNGKLHVINSVEAAVLLNGEPLFWEVYY